MRSIEEWILAATGHIRFPPDRKAVAEEIRASYEDHRDALLAAGETRDRASFLALQALGDPDEAGELLAQVHRPWLGWAWKISRWAAVAVSLLLFVAILRLMWEGLPSSYNFRSSVPDPVLQAESKDGPFSLVSRGSGVGSAKIGHYSFRVEDAQILRYEDEGECAFLLLNVRYPFWLHPPFALSYRLSAEDSTGRIFAKAHESGGLILPSWQTDGDPYVWPNIYAQSPGQASYWVALLGIQGVPEWISLQYDHGGHRFSLTARFEESEN